MITTLTLNPAVDITLVVKDITLGSLNWVQETRQSPGGKGINVSKALVKLGSGTVALGILAGNTGQWIADCLTEKGIPYDFVQGQGKTRTNLKILDQSTQTITEFNEWGSKASQVCMDKIFLKAEHYAKQSEFMVFSGSAPAGFDDDVYFELVSNMKEKVKTVLDTDGVLLAEGLKAVPYLVKHNLFELSRLFNKTLVRETEIVACGKSLLDKGIAKVIISRGAQGSFLITGDAAYKVLPVQVEVKTTVGAGDAMVGGFLHGLSQGLKDDDAMRLAAACAAAAVINKDNEIFDMQDVKKILPNICLQKID